MPLHATNLELGSGLDTTAIVKAAGVETNHHTNKVVDGHVINDGTDKENVALTADLSPLGNLEREKCEILSTQRAPSLGATS